MNKISFSLLFFTLFFSQNLVGQILVVTPEDPTVDSTITLIYDASTGNQALKDYTGDVYMHTGVITLESANTNDWKHTNHTNNQTIH